MRNYSIERIESFRTGGAMHGLVEVDYPDNPGGAGFPDVPCRVTRRIFKEDGTVAGESTIEILDFEEVSTPEDFFTVDSLVQDIVLNAAEGGAVLHFTHRDSNGVELLYHWRDGAWNPVPLPANDEGAPFFFEGILQDRIWKTGDPPPPPLRPRRVAPVPGATELVSQRLLMLAGAAILAAGALMGFGKLRKTESRLFRRDGTKTATKRKVR